MDFRLKVFAVTASTLNFTKAAELLGISQPAVTKHIQELEKEYGIQLFARHGAKLNITYQGACFLSRSKEILREYKELESAASMLKTAFSGSIRIGAPVALYYSVIPRLAADFCTLSPGVKMDLQIIESSEIHNAIKNGKIDAGFSFNSKSAKHFFIRDRMLLVSAGQTYCTADENADGEAEDLNANRLNMVSYKGDEETEAQLKVLLSAPGTNFSKVNVIATLDNVKSAIEFLVCSGKSGIEKKYNACAFLWHSQVAEYLKLGILHESPSPWANNSAASAERIYGIEGASSAKQTRFMEFASKWGEKSFEENAK